MGMRTNLNLSFELEGIEEAKALIEYQQQLTAELFDNLKRIESSLKSMNLKVNQSTTGL